MENKNIALASHVEPYDLRKWESVSRHSINNSSALISEMDTTLTNLKEYLKRLQYQYKLNKLMRKGVLNTAGAGDNLEKTVSEQLLLGHTIMSKTKHLLFLQKESDWATMKSLSSLSMKPSETSDTNVLLSTVSPSMSNTSFYSDELQNILREFNHILKPKESNSKSVLKLTTSTRRFQKAKCDGENIDFLMFLTEHLAKTNHQLKFSILPTNNNSEHAYACRLLHLSVYGKGKDKMTAKKTAAKNLVELLIDLQYKDALPESVNEFSKEELKMLTVQLCEFENYIVQLKTICNEKYMKPPTFSILQNKPTYTVQCSALGQIALGSNENKGISKRLAAKRIIELFKKSSGVSKFVVD